MVDTVQRHIKKLNWGYKVDLLTKAVDYINMLGKFKDAHTIECFKDTDEV
jgi:thioredoxin reductase (NADPH)